MKAEMEAQSDVKVVRMGMGAVVCNWGTHNGVPAVFIEPVLGAAGDVGAEIEEGREPQILKDAVSEGGVIIEFHSEGGANVLIEDIRSALKPVLVSVSRVAGMWDEHGDPAYLLTHPVATAVESAPEHLRKENQNQIQNQQSGPVQ